MKTRYTQLFILLSILLILAGCRLFSPEVDPTVVPTVVVPTVVAEVTPGDGSLPTATATATQEATSTTTATATVSPTATATTQPTATATQATTSPAVVRIQFPAGATYETVGGSLALGGRHHYLFRAQAGQPASVALTSVGDVASFSLSGVDDGLFHKTPNDPSRQWSGILPRSQDYLLEVNASQDTTYNLTLTIDPLPAPQPGSIGGLVYRDGNGNGSYDAGETVVPQVQIYLRPNGCNGTGLIANTTSAADGRYLFAAVQPGNYCVSTVTSNGYYDSRPVTLSANQAQEGIHLQAPQMATSPSRIQFPAGATSTTIQDELAHQEQAVYLFQANAGQVASVSVASPQNSVLFHLEGVSDGVIYKGLLDGNNSWEGALGQTQDYRLTLDNAGPGAATYTLQLSIVDKVAGEIRIQFPAGHSSASIQNQLASQDQDVFLFWAAAGQVASVSVASPENSVLFHLEGVSNGVVYKGLLDGESSWQGTLDQSQDYRLTVDNAGPSVAGYTLELSIVNAADG